MERIEKAKRDSEEAERLQKEVEALKVGKVAICKRLTSFQKAHFL